MFQVATSQEPPEGWLASLTTPTIICNVQREIIDKITIDEKITVSENSQESTENTSIVKDIVVINEKKNIIITYCTKYVEFCLLTEQNYSSNK